MPKTKSESKASTGAFASGKVNAYVLNDANYTVTWDAIQVGVINGKPVMDAVFESPESLRVWCDLNLTFIASIYTRLLGFREACAQTGMLGDTPSSTTPKGG